MLPADPVSEPAVSDRHVGVLAIDAMTRQLLDLLLQRLGAAPAIVLEDLNHAHALLRGPFDGVLVIAFEGADEAGLAGLRALAAARAVGARSTPQLVALIRNDADAACCLAAGADAVLMRPPRLAALRALLEPRAAAAPDLDPAALAELHRLYGDAGLAEIVQALTDDAPVQRSRAEAAIAVGDLVALRQIAHALRGISLQLGAESLATLCAQIEDQAAAGERAKAIAASATMLARHHALVVEVTRLAQAGREPTSARVPT